MVASFSAEISQDAAKERDEKAAARALAEKKRADAAKRRAEVAAKEKAASAGSGPKKVKKVEMEFLFAQRNDGGHSSLTFLFLALARHHSSISTLLLLISLFTCHRSAN